MAQNKETSIGVKLIADLRNYQKNLTTAQKQSRQFRNNVKTNVGDVKNSFTQLMRGDIRSLPDFFRSATGAAGGFSKGLKGVKAALISTGIGALLVGLGVAIGSITQYFKGTEEGQIVFKKVMNNVKAYTEPVLQMFGRFGKALVQLFSGEFGAAWETAKGAIEGVGDQIQANRGEVDKLNAAEEKYIKLKRSNLIENKRLEAEINEARRIANDEDNYSAATRAKAINEAIEKQKQLAANKKQELDLETQIAETKASFGDNDIATNDELAQLKARQYEIISEQERAVKRMGEDQQRINRELGAELEARRAIIASQNASRKETAQLTTVETRQYNGEMGTVDTKQLDDMGTLIDANTEKVQNFYDAIEAGAEASQTNMQLLAGSFGQIGAAIGGTTGGFLQMAAQMLELIPQLIAQVTGLTVAKQGEAIASGVAESNKVPFPLNLIAMAATMASIVSAFAKIPKFATGGVVGGNSFFGDNVIARVNSGEEIITRHDPRHRYNQGTTGGDSPSYLPADVKVMDDHILISYERARQRRRKRTGK